MEGNTGKGEVKDIVKYEVSSVKEMGRNKVEVKKEMPSGPTVMKKLSSWEPRRIVRVKNV